MAVNPDFNDEKYDAPQPNQGDLRFVEREVDNHGVPAKARILQRYEWSYTLSRWDWYDVRLVET